MLSIQGEDPDLAAYCAEVKKRALRRIGQLMDQQPKAKGGEPYYDDPHLDQPSALGSPRRRILGRKITDCRPIKLVAAMSEQRQEPVVQ